MNTPVKICEVCGREFEWRKKWKDVWDEVKYCSKRCRSTRLSKADRQLEETILSLLEQRANGATICPSEAARKVRPDDWREWMERARMAARRLVASDEIEICQKGRVVDSSTAKGPIRLRKR